MERIRRFFKKLGKKIGAKGYTLLEVAAVVAVTGSLAAVAMPVVSDKIAAGKLVAAQSEVQSIRDSIVNFMKDTGVPPFYTVGRNSLALPKETESFEWALVTKDGVNPTTSGAGTDWVSPLSYVPTIIIDLDSTLDGQLIDNTPKYPTMGVSAWKGPYIPSLKKDPWGNRYLVAIKWLAEPVGTVGGGSSTKYQRGVYVISAGPNGIIETSFNQKIRIIEAAAGELLEFKIGNDDIVSRIN